MAMEIPEAIRTAAKRQNVTVTQVAVIAGVTEAAARRWMKGEADITGFRLEILRRELPGLAALLDGKAA